MAFALKWPLSNSNILKQGIHLLLGEKSVKPASTKEQEALSFEKGLENGYELVGRGPGQFWGRKPAVGLESNNKESLSVY